MLRNSSTRIYMYMYYSCLRVYVHVLFMPTCICTCIIHAYVYMYMYYSCLRVYVHVLFMPTCICDNNLTYGKCINRGW